MDLEQIYLNLSDKIGGVSERVVALTQNVLNLQHEVEETKQETTTQFRELSSEITAIKLSLGNNGSRPKSSGENENYSETNGKRRSKLNVFEVWKTLPEVVKLGIILLFVLTLKDGLADALRALLAYFTK